MKTLPGFVPLLKRSFTGELKNRGTVESKKHPGVPQMLDSIRNFKMKSKLSVRLNQGGACAPMYISRTQILEINHEV